MGKGGVTAGKASRGDDRTPETWGGWEAAGGRSLERGRVVGICGVSTLLGRGSCVLCVQRPGHVSGTAGPH